jgi:hypothetical protein
MDWAALVAGVIALALFFVHAFAGGAELRLLVPRDATEKAWTARAQVVSGWHWISVDLLLAAIAFFVAGVVDIEHERAILAALAIWFAALGVVWLGTSAVVTKLDPRRMLRLPQWTACFLLAALAWLAR